MAKNASLPAGAGKGLAELRSRLWFVFLALLVYRIGAHIPVPGINPDRLAALFEQNQGTILSMFNMFSGFMVTCTLDSNDSSSSSALRLSVSVKLSWDRGGFSNVPSVTVVALLLLFSSLLN